MHVKVLYVICVPNGNDHLHEIERGGEALYHKYTSSDRRAAEARPAMVSLWHVKPRSGGVPLSVECIRRSNFVPTEKEEDIGAYLFAHGTHGSPIDFSAKDLPVIFEEIGIERLRKLSLVGCSLGSTALVENGKTEAARNFLQEACSVLAEKKLTPKIAGYSDFVTIVPADRLDGEEIGDKKKDIFEKKDGQLRSASRAEHAGRKAIRAPDKRQVLAKDRRELIRGGNDRKPQKLVYQLRAGEPARLTLADWSDKPG